LDDAGWTFTALRNHPQAEAFEAVVDDTYVLELPDGDNISVPESLSNTAQAELGEGEGIVVTFTPEIAEQYPSIRLLLPNDPLFELLVQQATPEQLESLKLICGKHGEGGSTVTQSNRIVDSNDAVVVEPAVTTDRDQNLLSGDTAIKDVEAAEETVLTWLSTHRRTTEPE
jgi:hypothetical protein